MLSLWQETASNGKRRKAKAKKRQMMVKRKRNLREEANTICSDNNGDVMYVSMFDDAFLLPTTDNGLSQDGIY